jgi:hypothetical protein
MLHMHQVKHKSAILTRHSWVTLLHLNNVGVNPMSTIFSGIKQNHNQHRFILSVHQCGRATEQFDSPRIK